MFLDRFGFCQLDYWLSNNNNIYPFISSKNQNKAELEDNGETKQNKKTKQKTKTNKCKTVQNDRRRDSIACAYLSLYIQCCFCCHRHVFQSRALFSIFFAFLVCSNCHLLFGLYISITLQLYYSNTHVCTHCTYDLTLFQFQFHIRACLNCTHYLFS